MTIEELNDILEYTANEMYGHLADLPQDTPAEISEAVGKILLEAAEKIRRLAKGQDKPEELTARETSLQKWKGEACKACDGLGGIAIAGPDKSWPAMACPKCGAGSTT